MIAKYRQEGVDGWVLTNFTMEQVEGRLDTLEQFRQNTHAAIDKIYELADEQLCDCYDEYNRKLTTTCNRCQIMELCKQIKGTK